MWAPSELAVSSNSSLGLDRLWFWEEVSWALFEEVSWALFVCQISTRKKYPQKGGVCVRLAADMMTPFDQI